MKKTQWGWLRPPSQGIWRYTNAWMRPLAAAAPWVTFAVVLAMMSFALTCFTAAPGVVFDLPSSTIREGGSTRLMALAMPMVRESGGGEETLVVFDDARFTISDPASASSLKRALEEKVAAKSERTLLLLADRRVSTGDLMALTSLSRAAGVKRLQIATRREGAN